MLISFSSSLSFSKREILFSSSVAGPWLITLAIGLFAQIQDASAGQLALYVTFGLGIIGAFTASLNFIHKLNDGTMQVQTERIKELTANRTELKNDLQECRDANEQLLARLKELEATK